MTRSYWDTLTQKALEDASFHVNSGAPAINGEALEQLVKEYREVEEIISKLSIRYPKILLDSLVYTSALSSKLLKKSSDLLHGVANFAKSLFLSTQT